MQSRWFPITMTVLNIVVLVGQVWPEGAPAFAPGVNIGFLVGA